MVQKLAAKGIAITWAEKAEEAPSGADQDGKYGGESMSGKHVKYVGSHEGCDENLMGRSGQSPLCQGNEKTALHDPASMADSS